MKRIDWKIFEQACDNAPQDKKELMNSTAIHDAAKRILGEKMNKENTTDIILVISYHVLGLNSIEKTLEELSSLNIPDVYNFLKSVLKDISNATPQTHHDIPQESLSNEIAQAEHELASVQGLRTMATDMQAHTPAATGEVVYRSAQADILPTRNPDAPRWESE